MRENTKTITELIDILDQDIETIVALRITAERKVSRHQRLIEKVKKVIECYLCGKYDVYLVRVDTSSQFQCTP